jgi:hypothetical protein
MYLSIIKQKYFKELKKHFTFKNLFQLKEFIGVILKFKNK